MPGRLVSIKTTSGLGKAGQGVLGAGVLAEATETFGAVQQAGQRAPQLPVILDQGNG